MHDIGSSGKMEVDAQLSKCSSGRMEKTIEAGATDAQLETLGELLLLEANYLQYSCDYQSQKRYFLQAAVFYTPFP